jgi:hypothetical protein
MIQESVTCDVCGENKLETHHWFMALEHKGTLKISSWGKLTTRSSMKHLCGQTCVHRFVDSFLAGDSGSSIGPDVHLQSQDNAATGKTSDSGKIVLVAKRAAGSL